MSKWLFITRPEFWEDLKPPNNNWIYRRDDKRIKSGDNAIIYVSRFGFITSAIEILEPIKPRNRVSSFPYKTSIKFMAIRTRIITVNISLIPTWVIVNGANGMQSYLN